MESKSKWEVQKCNQLVKFEVSFKDIISHLHDGQW